MSGLVDDPIVGDVTSAKYNEIALFKVLTSEILVESRACFKSSAGFKVNMTATASTAMIAITTRSSMRVKPFEFLMIFFIFLINISKHNSTFLNLEVIVSYPTREGCG